MTRLVGLTLSASTVIRLEMCPASLARKRLVGYYLLALFGVKGG
jgi:hypothetical protein